MANEVLVRGSLVYDDSVSDPIQLAIGDLFATVADKLKSALTIAVGITERAIPLGDVTAPGWAIFVNRDPTNFIELRVGTAGAKFGKMLPGEFAILRLGAGAQAPYAIADTSPCMMEYIICAT